MYYIHVSQNVYVYIKHNPFMDYDDSGILIITSRFILDFFYHTNQLRLDYLFSFALDCDKEGILDSILVMFNLAFIIMLPQRR